MSATTIKIESPLLDQLVKILPKDRSISAYVREVIEQDIRRKELIEAAEKYCDFLEAHPDEKGELEEWESFSLDLPPKKTSAKGKKK